MKFNNPRTHSITTNSIAEIEHAEREVKFENVVEKESSRKIRNVQTDTDIPTYIPTNAHLDIQTQMRGVCSVIINCIHENVPFVVFFQ